MEKHIFAILLLMFSSLSRASDRCHFDLYRYNLKRKEIVGPKRVSMLRKDLPKDHIDPKNGCSVCEEDQVRVTLYNGKSFLICKVVAAAIEGALNKALISGFRINEITGYVVKKTRGKVDSKGYRTGLSNHSFGLSIDINRSHNGLYENCERFSEECRLAHGGNWSENNNLSITESTALVKLLAENGFQWGGKIAGSQKDFMHFSPTGY